MNLATPADMRSSFGAEEVAALTRLYMERLPLAVDDAPESEPTEESVLSWGVARASSRAVSYLAARYPVFGKASLPEGVSVPPALVHAVCDIARYFLTGTAVQETDPIVERYKDALAWLKEIAAGEAVLPGFESVDDGTEDAVTGAVVFASNERQWSAST